MNKDINSNELNELLSEKKLVIVDFHATWCGPCKMLGPVIDELINDYQTTEGVSIVKMDVDNNIDTATKYNVRGVPTILFVKDGKEVDRMVGYKNKHEIQTKIESLE